MQKLSYANIPETFKNNRTLLILCVQVALLHIGLGLISPILPLYSKIFSVSTALVGFLLTAQMLPRVFVNVPAGRLADKWGANRLLVVSAGIITLSAIGGALTTNYTLFLVTRLLQGVGTGISHTAGFTYAATISTPSNRAQFVTLYQGSFLLGLGIGPVIGGLISQYFGYQASFMFYAMIALGVALWVHRQLPDPRKNLKKEKPSSEEKPRPSMRQLLRHPGILLVSLIGLASGYTRGGTRNMAISLQGYAMGMSESQIGLVLSGVFLMTVLALVLMSAMADRFDRKRVIAFSWGLIAIVIVIMANAQSYVLFFLSTAIYGLLAGVGSAIPAAYVADVADEQSRGTAIGVFRTFSDGGAVLGPLAMGWIIDQASIKTGLIINAAFVFLIVILFWNFSPEFKVSQQHV